MVWKSSDIPPQFLLNEDTYVTIIEIKDPGHFIIKESPSIKSPRTLEFLEFEDAMQKYYNNTEQDFFQLPLRNTLLVAHFENKYYRARVCSILNMTRGYVIKVYLMDYGKECSVTRPCLYEIPEQFLKIPFQVVDFRLDLEPISLVMDPCDITLDYGPVPEWDVSALAFIENMCKVMKNTFVRVQGTGQSYVTGTMHVSLQNGEIKCINDELVLKKFAREKTKCMNDEKVHLPAVDASFQKEKSIPDSSQSLVASTLASKSSQNEMSSTQKLRALLKKRYKLQTNISVSSTDVKESVMLNSNTRDLSLKSVNYEKKDREDVFKQEELQKDVKCNRSEDDKDLNIVLGLAACKLSNDLDSSANTKVSSEVNDIPKNITVEAMKENQCAKGPVKLTGAFHLKRLLQLKRDREERALKQKVKDTSMDQPQITNDSSSLNSVENKQEQVVKNCIKVDCVEPQTQSESSSLHYDSNAISIKSDAAKKLSRATDINQSSSVESKMLATATTQQPEKPKESSQQVSSYEKFRQMYRKNRLFFAAKNKENLPSEAVQTPEESNVINNFPKSNKHEFESSTSEKEGNVSEETSCMKPDDETSIFKGKESVTEKTCKMDNPQQVIPDPDFFEINDSSSDSQNDR